MAITPQPVLSSVFGVYRGATKFLCDDPGLVTTGQVLSTVDTSSWFNYPMVAPWHFGYAVTKELATDWEADIVVRGSADSTAWVPLASFKIGSDPENLTHPEQITGRDSFNTDTLYQYYSFYVNSSQANIDGTNVSDASVAYMRVGIQAPAA